MRPIFFRRDEQHVPYPSLYTRARSALQDLGRLTMTIDLSENAFNAFTVAVVAVALTTAALGYIAFEWHQSNLFVSGNYCEISYGNQLRWVKCDHINEATKVYLDDLRLKATQSWNYNTAAWNLRLTEEAKKDAYNLAKAAAAAKAQEPKK